MGATLIALRALNVIERLEDIDNFLSLQESYQPDVNVHRVYHGTFESYLDIYDRLLKQRG